MSSSDGTLRNGTSSSPVLVRLESSDWDIASRDKLAKILEPAAAYPNVILDLSAVRFMDSTCLGRLAHMEQERQRAGLASARLVIASENIRRLFKVVAFDRIWPIFNSVDEALSQAPV
jgi:anti-anti-sigma factor